MLNQFLSVPVPIEFNYIITNQVECLYNRALKVLDRKQIRYHRCQILSKYKILSFAHFVFFHYVNLCLNV